MSIEDKINLIFYWTIAQMFFTILGAILNMIKDGKTK
jgi:hypothetical protein